jgi:hypothetical protein
MDTLERRDVSGLAPIEEPGLVALASPGTERHARTVAARAGRAHAWLSELLGFPPRVEVCVLAPGDWGRVTPVPVFGFPHFVGEGTLVVAGTPAPFFDEQLVGLIRPGLDNEGRFRLRAVYGDPPRVQPFSDLLVVHELAHLYHAQSGFWFPERWLSELFCNLALEGWVVEHEPELTQVLHTLPQLGVAAIDPATLPVRDLARMEQALDAGPAGPANYAWYQMRLEVAATAIWSCGGPDTLRRLLDRFRGGEPPADLRAALRDDVHPSVADVIDDWPAAR